MVLSFESNLLNSQNRAHQLFITGINNRRLFIYSQELLVVQDVVDHCLVDAGQTLLPVGSNLLLESKIHLVDSELRRITGGPGSVISQGGFNIQLN